jgi:transcriptional regulator with GAF, ATPase, and Fis domain
MSVSYEAYDTSLPIDCWASTQPYVEYYTHIRAKDLDSAVKTGSHLLRDCTCEEKYIDFTRSKTNKIENTLHKTQKELVIAALEEEHWHQALAAVRLGISGRQMNYLIREYKINPPDEQKSRWRRKN